jgi:hypothetical protein
MNNGHTRFGLRAGLLVAAAFCFAAGGLWADGAAASATQQPAPKGLEPVSPSRTRTSCSWKLRMQCPPISPGSLS